MENEKQDERYPLDDAAIAIIQETRAALDQVKAEYDRLSAQLNGALSLFVRQHKLQGKWNVDPNGRELVKAAEQPIAAAQ